MLSQLTDSVKFHQNPDHNSKGNYFRHIYPRSFVQGNKNGQINKIIRCSEKGGGLDVTVSGINCFDFLSSTHKETMSPKLKYIIYCQSQWILSAYNSWFICNTVYLCHLSNKITRESCEMFVQCSKLWHFSTCAHLVNYLHCWVQKQTKNWVTENPHVTVKLKV